MNQNNKADEHEVRSLYQSLIQGWNERDADRMAKCCSSAANFIGFDGSQLNGRDEIQAELKRIFKSHQTPPFLVAIQEIRFLSGSVAIVRANVGMIPPGKSSIQPELNAIQTAIVSKESESWRIAVFQNTPAAFHGRPELQEKFTQELQTALRSSTPA